MLQLQTTKQQINGFSIETIDARLLAKELELNAGNFARWSRRVIKDMQMIENIDYLRLVVDDEQTGRGGHNSKE